MIAIEIAEPGGAEVLRPVRRPIPRPGPHQLLVRVAAAGVNRPDILQRLGRYAPPPGASEIPGLEIAGHVEGMGEAVTGWAVGDSVCALLPGGGYAEFALADAGSCLPIPAGLPLADAAALPETAFTVWTNLIDGGRLRGGAHVLIHGGTSGIGVMAIQMVRALGGFAHVTAGSEDKLRFCLDLGAVTATDYRRNDFVETVRHATDGRGVDIVLDMVGGDYLVRNMDACAPGGRIVMIAHLGGATPSFSIPKLMAKRLTVTGSTLRPRSAAEKREIRDALLASIWPLIGTGAIRPVIDSRYPLGEAAEAHRRMESSAHIGKILLDMPHAQGS